MFDENQVVDAGICHGSMGLVMIFRHMYIETGINDFLLASEFWLKRTSILSEFNDGLAGFKSFIMGKWVCDHTLLTGISGIGIMLISHLKNDEQAWEEMFLL